MTPEIILFCTLTVLFLILALLATGMNNSPFWGRLFIWSAFIYFLVVTTAILLRDNGFLNV